MFYKPCDRRGKSLNVLPVEQRAEIVKYLYQCREEVCLDAGELLYYAIMSDSKRIIKVLQKLGVTLTERRIINITENGRSFEWYEFCNMLDTLGDQEYMRIVGSLSNEIGGKPFHLRTRFTGETAMSITNSTGCTSLNFSIYPRPL